MTTQLWEHWDAMVRAAKGVLGCRDAAGDCASEAFAQALEMSLDDVVNLEAFLVVVAKRRAVDLIRTEQRARRREQTVGTQFVLDVQDVAEDVAARAEARWVEEQALLLLRPQVFELVRLVADGMSIEAAAAQLGMTRDSAASHLKRARTVMRSALAKALVALGTIGSGLRRVLGPSAASATATVAAALALAVELVFTRPPSSPEFALAPTTLAQPGQVKVTPHTTTPSTAEAAGSGQGRSTGAQDRPTTSRQVAQVDTPAVGVRVEEHDDGQDNGDVVSRMLACARNLRYEPETGYLGCEGPESRPSDSLNGGLVAPVR